MNVKMTSASSFNNYIARRMSSITANVSTFTPSAANSNFQTMSPSKNNHQHMIADDLVRRLQNLLLIIEKFFALPGTSDILERKISQFEAMIAEFPADAERAADYWRDKAISLWQRLLTGKPEPTSSGMSANILASTVSPSRAVNKVGYHWKSLLVTPNASISKNQLEADSLLSPNGKNIKSKLDSTGQQLVLMADVGTQTPARSNMANIASTAAVTNFLATSPGGGQLQSPQQSTEEQQKQALCASLQKTFAELSDIQNGYGPNLDSVKRLLKEVAKAERELARYSNDTRLQFNIFNSAFRKLPTFLRDQFLSIYGVRQNGINLKNLIAFLQAEIVAQHSKTVWLLSMLASKDKPNSTATANRVNGQVAIVGGGNQPPQGTNRKGGRRSLGPVAPKWPVPQGAPGSANHCRYCKVFGHMAADCPYIKELLCFQCYNYGHTKKGCPNAPLI